MSLVPFTPMPGPQSTFLSTSATIALIGGGAGGSKSVSLIVEPLRHIHKPGFNALIFRRDRPQLTQAGGLVDTCRELYTACGGKLNLTNLKWTFPSNATIQFVGLQYDASVFDWQGAQIQFLGIDELTHFGESAFWYLTSRLRNGTDNGVIPYCRLSCNPDIDHFIKQFISWWLDAEGYPIKERAGVVRWYARVSGVVHWADSEQELADKGMKGVSFTFVPSLIFDNKILLNRDPSYLAQLESLPTHERLSLLGGCWNARASAGAYFPRSRAIVVDALPAGIEFVRGWDFASTEPSETNKDPDFTATVKIGRGSDGLTYIAHAEQEQINSHAVIQKLKAYHSQEPNDRISIPIDPGAAGKYVSDDIVREVAGASITATRVSGNKEVRSRPLSAQWMAGNVRVLKAPWNAMFLDSMDGFPVGGHDDVTDAANEAYALLTTGAIAQIRSL